MMAGNTKDADLRVQLDNCRQQLATTGTSLRTIHGDLRYFQVAFDEVAAEVKRLNRDNELLLSCLDRFVDWDEEWAENCDSPETPKPPTTPTTPCTPWGTPREEKSGESEPSTNNKTSAAGAVAKKPRRNSI